MHVRAGTHFIEMCLIEIVMWISTVYEGRLQYAAWVQTKAPKITLPF